MRIGTQSKHINNRWSPLAALKPKYRLAPTTLWEQPTRAFSDAQISGYMLHERGDPVVSSHSFAWWLALWWQVVLTDAHIPLLDVGWQRGCSLASTSISWVLELRCCNISFVPKGDCLSLPHSPQSESACMHQQEHQHSLGLWHRLLCFAVFGNQNCCFLH